MIRITTRTLHRVEMDTSPFGPVQIATPRRRRTINVTALEFTTRAPDETPLCVDLYGPYFLLDGTISAQHAMTSYVPASLPQEIKDFLEDHFESVNWMF